MPATNTRLDGALETRRRARTNTTATRNRYSLCRFLKAAHDALAAGDDPKTVDIAARIYVHAKKLPNAPAYGQTGGIVCPNGRNAMTDRSESRDIESDVEESGDAGRSSVDRTQSARPSPSELSSETDTTAIDLSGRQIGQVMMEALSRLFQTPNEETIIDADVLL